MSFLGLPADPTWADHILGIVEQKKRIEEIDGIGCQPVLISATTEEMLEWIGDGLRSRALAFPEWNGAVIWPRYSVEATLNPRRGGLIAGELTRIGVALHPIYTRPSYKVPLQNGIPPGELTAPEIRSNI